MTAVLTPEEVEARLRTRKAFFRNGAIWCMSPEPDSDCIAAADTIADLRRQRDEARAECERLHPKPEPMCGECGLPISECSALAIMRQEDERNARLQAAESALAYARAECERLAATVTAWDHVFGTIQAHLRDRIAMQDDANPSTYLSIIESNIGNLSQDAQQIYAATQHRYQAAEAESERQRERAEKAEHWSQLRDEDIMKLGQEVGKWQAAAEAERERIIRDARVETILPVFDDPERTSRSLFVGLSLFWAAAIRALPPPTIEPSVTEKALPGPGKR